MAVYGLEQLNRNAQTAARTATGAPVYNAGTNNATAGRTTRSVSDLSQTLPTGGEPRTSNGIPPQDSASSPVTPSPVGTYFDPTIAAAQRRLQESQGQLTADYTRQASQIEQDSIYQKDLAARQHQQALQYLRDQMASQGILRSGIYVGEQGELGEQQQDLLYQLQSQTNNQLNAALAAYNQGMQSTYGQLEQLMSQKAAAEAQWQMQEADRIAREQANQKHLEDVERLVRSTQPTVSPTGKIQTVGNVKGDQAYFGSQEDMMKRIQNIFENRGVGLDVGAATVNGKKETEQQRLQRIAQEVLSGKRDLASVRQSVTTLGKKEAEKLRRELGLV